MAETAVNIPVSTPRKRSHEGDLIGDNSITSSNVLPSDLTKNSSRQPSPALSDATSELTDLTSISMASPNTIKVFVDDASHMKLSASNSVKKRKLTYAEKEVEKAVKQREKDQKAKQKSDERTRKEEEKRQKDEDKRKREEEKEASKRVKELEKAEKKKARDVEKQERGAEKARKDAEKREKELDKVKREKSQLRIGAFFGRPAPQSTPPATPDDVSSKASSRRSSIVAIDVVDAVNDSDLCQPANPANPDFDKYIIPYFIHENTEIAPVNRFRTASKRDSFQSESPGYAYETEKANISPLRTRFGPPRKRIRMSEPVKDIVERIQATQIDITDIDDEQNPLSYVPYKILSFREDIRPPYSGTYTKAIVARTAKKMSRNPYHRGRIDTNYDYDSEAEWEEPAADDEEILDDEMSESEDGDDEMQDFLDDENDQGRKRLFVGEMEPISSGLCFQGSDFDSNGHNMEDYHMDVLHDSVTWPIDPFSTTHWADAPKPASSKSKAESEPATKPDLAARSMPPPRVPLTTLNSPNVMMNFLSSDAASTASNNENLQPIAKQRGRPANPNKEVKMIPVEFMDAFKRAINDSDLTKAGLIEILKKQFPKCSKDAIKDTLGVIAVRVGKKEAEKKWALI